MPISGPIDSVVDCHGFTGSAKKPDLAVHSLIVGMSGQWENVATMLNIKLDFYCCDNLVGFCKFSHIYPHVSTHVCMHANIYKYTHIMYAHTCIYTYTYCTSLLASYAFWNCSILCYSTVNTHAFPKCVIKYSSIIDSCEHTHIRKHYTHTHTYTYTYIHIHTHTCTHTYIHTHTHIHTYIHIHIHIHTHT